MRNTARRVGAFNAARSVAAGRVLFLATILTAHCIDWSRAQEHLPIQYPSYYLGAAFSDNISKAAIDAYDGSTLCGVFSHGSRNAISPFAGLSFPISGKWSLGGKAQYRNLSTGFDIPVESSNPPFAQDPSGQYIQIDRGRTFDVTLGMASLSMLASYDLFSRLSLSAGPFAGILVRHTYSESEYIVNAPNARYQENGMRTRAISSGALSDMHTFQAGLDFSISYDLPFQSHLWLRPSVGGMVQLTRSISDRSTGSWWVNPVSASLSLVYRVEEPPVMPPLIPSQFAVDTLLRVPSPPTPEPVKKQPVLRVSIKALGVLDDGTETPEPILSIERMHVTEVYPMLHYVFFDDGSSAIPERYHQEHRETITSFNEKALYTSTALEIHHHVLDILGHRLAQNPKATITLTGNRSTHSPADSAIGQNVSRGRAESVAKYLEEVWGIPSDRVHIRVRNLPDAPSDDRNPSGEAENRRVEIVPSSPDIIEPLWTERIERVATPPRIDFTPEIVTSAGVKTATIVVRQRDRVLQTFDALTGGSTGEYVWTLSGPNIPEGGDSLTYTFNVLDSSGATATASGVIRVRQELKDVTKHTSDTSLDKQLERYSLILFDYSSSQLDKKQSDKILKEMAAAIHKASQVTLTGHTDRTGDDAFNDRLAGQRVNRAAEMLEEELGRLRKEKHPMQIESHGSRDVLFDNSIPEGRVLSRTVRALIENDAK